MRSACGHVDRINRTELRFSATLRTFDISCGNAGIRADEMEKMRAISRLNESESHSCD